MTRNERFIESQASLGLNNRKTARMLCVSVRSVERWRAGSVQVPALVLKFMELVAYLSERHRKIYTGWRDKDES